MTKQERIKKLFDQLDISEQKKVLRTLENRNNKRSHQVRGLSVEACPHCGSVDYSKNGKRVNLQRYICKDCKRSFSGKSGTIIHGIKDRKKFDRYFKLMIEQYLPLSVMAKKVGISHQTAFDWRHKILSSIKISTEEFNGITEMDDIWFLYSQKGRKGLKYSRVRGGSHRKGDNNYQVKLLITADRQDEKDMSVLKIGRISKADIQRKISGKFNPSCILVSDKHRSISSFARSEGIQHKRFISSKHTAGKDYHVQNVNNMATRLKNVVNHQLRGVSTKYLQNYSNWFGQIEDIKNQPNGIKQVKKTLMQDKEAWDRFTCSEMDYKKFIKGHSERTYRCPTKRRWKTSVSNANTGRQLI
jgi:transposase-like protein/flagellin-specific chaperone FliS